MIISFYSYKGGVGRTQLTANLAAYLCYYKQRKVLIIDWDMEAPGVDFFFNIDRSNIKFGLLDLFNEFVKTVRSKENVTDKDLPKVFEKNGILENKKSKYIINLIKSQKNQGRVDLIPAGNYNDNFVKKVTSFDWYEFYETLNGKYFIEYLKEELNNSEYDYVFIDSRTGTSDYAGICNIQFPELNVFVIAPTNQNFKGCREIINSIFNSPYVKNGLRKPIIIPILSRLDRTDKISGEWFGKFRETFKDVIWSFLGLPNINESDYVTQSEITKFKDKNINDYIENTLLEYKTEISYGEQILFYDDLRIIEYTTLEKQILEIANNIEKLNPKNQQDAISKIKNAISEGNLESAINLFSEQVKNTSFENDIILFKSRFSSLRKNELLGILPQNEIAIEYSKISHALLNLLSDFSGTKKFSNQNNTFKQQRINSIKNQLEQYRKMLYEYENEKILSSDPKRMMRAEIEIKRLVDLIKIAESELKDIENE